MNVIPAIDLLEGKVVRLREGKRDTATVFSDAPWELARAYAGDGARTLHIVDLEGAFAGRRAQASVIERVIAAFAGEGRTVQVGGGIRTADDIEALLAAGAGRVVLGTLAVRAPDVAEGACRRWPDRILVAVDARDGRVRVDGWEQASSVDVATLARTAVGWGAAGLLYTDIARDGKLEGPNVEATARLQALVGDAMPVIASGGVGSLGHVRALVAAGVRACVVGRALYDRVFTLREALAAC